MKPIIAIIGRPNVGKSTLFNRIIGRRKAITLDTPGVSRDRHYGDASWDRREFLLVDTGGFPFEPQGSLQKEIRKQIDYAINEAALLLLVVDGREGLHPEEGEIVRMLRRKGKPVLVAVNKIDTPGDADPLTDFYPLGLPLLPVSAEHGLGVGELLDQVVREFPEGLQEEKDHGVRMAIIGRPNVGKSTLLNRLLGQERVVVHEEPGTTRDVIDTELQVGDQRYTLLDTAGIRRRGTWASRLERYSVLRSLQAIERSDLCLLILDAGEEIARQEAHIAGLAERKGVLIVWNKWDLVKAKRGIEKAYEQRVADSFRFLSHAPVLFVSGKTGYGCDSIWPAARSLYEECGKRVSTHRVNEVFQALIDEHNPPVYQGRPVRFKYATQTATHPPTFVVFVSEPKGVHFSFKRYLVNGLRKNLGFNGAPLEILFRRK